MASRRAFFAGGLALLASPWALADEAATWERLRKGAYVLLMRHASTEPGLGDPKGMRIGDCSTQRNLSEAGRDEARRIGERFKRERVRIHKVYTSPWCRCRETAMLAFGKAEDWEPLSSFFDLPHREQEFTQRVNKRIGNYSTRNPQQPSGLTTTMAPVATESFVSAAMFTLCVTITTLPFGFAIE